jgi:hypothetical protein
MLLFGGVAKVMAVFVCNMLCVREMYRPVEGRTGRASLFDGGFVAKSVREAFAGSGHAMARLYFVECVFFMGGLVFFE